MRRGGRRFSQEHMGAPRARKGQRRGWGTGRTVGSHQSPWTPGFHQVYGQILKNGRWGWEQLDLCSDNSGTSFLSHSWNPGFSCSHPLHNGQGLAGEGEGDLRITSFTLECNREGGGGPLLRASTPAFRYTLCLSLTRPPTPAGKPGRQASSGGSAPHHMTDEGRREGMHQPKRL